MNCKLGDLAVVVRADLACNLGNIVHIIGDIELKGRRPVWIVTCKHPIIRRVNGKRCCCMRGPAPDNYLQPILGTSQGARERGVHKYQVGSLSAFLTESRHRPIFWGVLDIEA